MKIYVKQDGRRLIMDIRQWRLALRVYRHCITMPGDHTVPRIGLMR